MSEHRIDDQVLTRDEFYRWTADHPGRFERIDGRLIAMAPERIAHVRVKAAVWVALRDALRQTGLSKCEALTDGVTVPIGADQDYKPDCLVRCGERADDQALTVSDPIIVVEVLSRSNHWSDTGAKLTGYFSVPSVHHYLIVDPHKKTTIHHQRVTGTEIHTRIAISGFLLLNPPNVTINTDDFFLS